MCWNQDVSLNTFVFSMGVLLLIIYNNAYTKYKIKHFTSIYVVLFYMSFICIQLIECFIWRNLNHSFYNPFFSFLGLALLWLQPIASTMMITQVNLRNKLVMSYLAMAVPYGVYKMYTNRFYSSVSKMGHLRWNFIDNDSVFVLPIWLFFFLISMVVQKQLVSFVVGCVTFGITYFNYQNDHSMGSNWCWVANGSMLFWATYLLVYLPFYEQKTIC